MTLIAVRVEFLLGKDISAILARKGDHGGRPEEQPCKRLATPVDGSGDADWRCELAKVGGDAGGVGEGEEQQQQQRRALLASNRVSVALQPLLAANSKNAP